jgi:hypothetical protein
MAPRSISDAERQAIRRYYATTNPKPRQKDIVTWFEKEYGRKLGQASISDCLQDRYKHLDAPIKADPRAYRAREGKWPLLERILFSWQQQFEVKGLPVSGELLAEKARDIWLAVPEYNTKQVPEFSPGWLGKFKSRFKLKQFESFGEIASVPHTAHAEMDLLRAATRQFLAPYLYNMDETGLYWRWALSRGLSTATLPGVKKDKARVSLALCSNGNGSDKLPPWVIGKAKLPHALRGVNVSALGVQWRSSKKAWMNGDIMAEWLQSFYRHVGNEVEVILLMDNFSAHRAAMEIALRPRTYALSSSPRTAPHSINLLIKALSPTSKPTTNATGYATVSIATLKARILLKLSRFTIHSYGLGLLGGSL